LWIVCFYSEQSVFSLDSIRHIPNTTPNALDFFACQEDSLLGVISVGDNEVSDLAGFDGAYLAQGANGLCGVPGGSPDSFLFRNVPGNNILEALPQVGGGAGDGIGACQLGNTPRSSAVWPPRSNW